MKAFLTELFSENGKISSMRAMAFAALLLGGSIAIYGMAHSNPDYSGIALLSGVFVGAAFGGKVMQKRSEVAKAEEDLPIKASEEAETPIK